MKDTLKWIAATLVLATAVWAGGEAIGLNWSFVQQAGFYFLLAFGVLLLLFTGSAAAIEVAKYYRSKNRALKEEDASLLTQDINEKKLQTLLQNAVLEAMREHEHSGVPKPALNQEVHEAPSGHEQSDNAVGPATTSRGPSREARHNNTL